LKRIFSIFAVATMLTLALLTVASCSAGNEDTAIRTDATEGIATTERTSPQGKSVPVIPPESRPDPAFDPLVSTLRQMTTAPIMLPATLPPHLKSVAIGNDPNNEGGPYNTSGDKYTILFLNPNASPRPDPTPIVQPYAHYKVAGTLTASPTSDPRQPDPSLFSASGATVQRLGNVGLSDGTVANLERVVPPEGANYVSFTVGTFEEEDERYTLSIEVDTPEGDLARQVLSTMVRMAKA
jgi:hypothetical protein